MIVAAPPLIIDEQNPWPGLSAFDEAAERFFNGRTDETAALRRLVVQAPLTVLFGASGLGKTSLLQAGLFPQLRHDHFLPIYIRLDAHDRTAPLIEQARAALLAAIGSQHVDAPPLVSAESLWEYLHRTGLELWSDDNHLLAPVFVFDQFEEVFTLGATNVAAVARLRIDLADLIENRMPEILAARVSDHESAAAALSLDRQRYKVVLSFREDFLPAVEGLKRAMPSIMRNRLRLLPMSSEQAFEAVHLTAPHLADEQMARSIVAFVAGAGERSASPEEVDDLANQVEPALLSLVCHGLNEKRKARAKARFDHALLEGTGQSIVADFYRDKTADMPLHVRRFIQDELITERGFRKPCDADDARRVHGVSDGDLRLLVDRRLLRIEPARGTERVELTHDLLTGVVRQQRDLDRQQIRFAKERRQRRRLTTIGVTLAAITTASVGLAFYFQSLRTEAVRNAESARRNEVAAQASADSAQRALEDATREKERADGLVLVSQSATDAAQREQARAEQFAMSEARERANAVEQQQRAETEAREAEAQRAKAETALNEADKARTDANVARDSARASAEVAEQNQKAAQVASQNATRFRNLAIAQELAARARVLQRADDIALAAQMALHAFVIHARNACGTSEVAASCPPDQIEPNLLAALQTSFNRLTQRFQADWIGAGGILSSGAGGSILSGVASGSVAPGRTGGPAAPVVVSARIGGGAYRVGTPADWRAIGSAQIWETQIAPAIRRMTSVAARGLRLLAGDVDGNIFMWPAESWGGGQWPAQPPLGSPVVAIALSPDGNTAISAAADGTLRRHDRVRGVLNTQRQEMGFRTLLFASPDLVLAGTSNGVFTWDMAGPPKRVDSVPYVDTRSLAVSADGRRVAFGDRLGAIRIAAWNGTSMSSVETLSEAHASAVDALAFSPAGGLLASGGADGTVRLFPIGRTIGDPAVLEGHAGRVQSVFFDDNALLYSGGADGTVRVWVARMDMLAAGICRIANPRQMQRLSSADEATLARLLPPGVEAGNPCTLVDPNPLLPAPASR